MRVLLVLFSSLFGSILSEEGFCLDYVECMQKLEEKQSGCVNIEKNLRHRQTSACFRKKWEIKLELNGLHLRRTEMARDCVQRSINDAPLAESTLHPDTMATCHSLHTKFAFAPGKSTVPKEKKVKRSASSKKKTNNSQKTRLVDCRNDAKLWHKQCSAIAKCCPIVEDCKLATRGIMDQISAEREKLNALKEQCE